MIFGLFFKKNLAIANGLASSGSGFGSFIFPYVMLYLLEKYSIQGCLIILGGISLNICVFSSLFRPFSFWRKTHYAKYPEKSLLSREGQYDEISQGKIQHYNILLHNKIYIRRESDDRQISNSVPCLKKELEPFTERRATFSDNATDIQTETKKRGSTRIVPTAMLFASVESIPSSIHDLRTTEKPSYVINSTSKTNGDIQSGRKGKQYLNWSLLKDFKFQMLNWGIFCAIYGHHTLFNFVPTVAEEYGFSDTQGTIAVSVVGVCDLIGRISTGLVSNSISLQRITVYRINLFLFCILTFSVTFTSNFWVFVVMCGFLGVFTGGYVGIQMAVLVEKLGKENLSSAWGYISFFVSISLLINPFVSGKKINLLFGMICSLMLLLMMTMMTKMTLRLPILIELINQENCTLCHFT